MRILQVHNYYQQSGGEDVVVAAEQELLRAHGHDVGLYQVSNNEITGFVKKVKTAWQAPYSRSARLRFAEEIAAFRPDVVHCHNTFPMLTSSIYDACRDADVPVVQTLHNFRPVCPGALLLRNEKICEECVRGNAYRAALHRCYQGSLLGSMAVGRMVQHHRKHETWQNKVDSFIALTPFAKEKFVEADFPAEKIAVKPNFLNGVTATGEVGRGGDALFVGRLSHEKGVKILLEAWEQLAGKIPLKVVGDGPLSDLLKNESARMPGVEWLGRRTREEVLSLMREASMLVLPSICYEGGLPLTIIEAYSVGLPVIASNLGSMSSLVEHGRTGLHFLPGDAQNLVAQVDWALAHPAEFFRMRSAARGEFDIKYSAEKNYDTLMEIYQKVIDKNKNVA